MLNDIYDVAIIGGGPAGSTAANLLSQSGLKVILLEKEYFPRPHVGESLLPFCYDIFKKLGVLDRMIERFPRKPGAIFSDSNNESATTFCFKHVVEHPQHLSFHVRRDDFDLMLLESARENGATVIEGAKVLNVSTDDQKVELKCRKSDGRFVLRAKFVIDASGRDGLIAKQNSWRVKSPDMDRIAFHSYWNFSTPSTDIQLSMIRIIYLDQCKKGWIWCIPISEHKLSVGLVVENQYVRAERVKYSTEKWEEDFYLNEIMLSNYLKKELTTAERDNKIYINGDYSYTSTCKWDKKFAIVGDAGQFIDPIFSSGVFIAMKSSELLCEVLPEFLRTQDDSLLESVYEKVSDGYETIESLIHLYYNPHLLNFSSLEAISKGGDSYGDFKSSYSLLHYLLAGDFFERGHVYKEFFKTLRDEKKFKQWQNLVHWESPESGVYSDIVETCL